MIISFFTLPVECFADGNVCYIEKFYMSAHLLLYLLNELRVEVCQGFYCSFTGS